MPEFSSPNNIDALLRQATCAILGPDRSKEEAVATAWIFGNEKYLASAGHTFSEKGVYASAKEGDTVYVKFLDENPRASTLVKACFDQSKGIDFAILKLEPASKGEKFKKRRSLPLVLLDDVEGEFRLRGYGQNLPNQQSVGTGAILGTLIRENSVANKLLQLRSPELAHQGFSGGAVYSEKLEAVIGIQTEAIHNSQSVFAMPLLQIVKYWEEIEQYANLPGKCFVVAPEHRIDKLVKTIRPIVLEELSYSIVKSVGTEISQQDLRHIEQAELIIADITDGDPSIIYELAVGHGAGIPDIVLCESGEDRFSLHPFNLTFIEINDEATLNSVLSTRVKAIRSTINELDSVPTNLITNSLRTPLTQISPSYGLALGHFYNFVSQVGEALIKADLIPSISIKIDGKEISDELRDKTRLKIVIPARLSWADHEYIKQRLKKKDIANASVSLPDRPRPFTLWALINDDKEDVVLADVFPTTMSVIAKAIDQRLGVKTNIQVNRERTEWRELEDKEIRRFSSSLIRLINSNDELSEIVEVVSWRDVFPELD